MNHVDHKAKRIKDGIAVKGEAEKKYAAWLAGKKVPLEYEIAFDTYETFDKREKLESLLIGGCPDDVLVNIMGIPEKTISIYKELFFDLSVLYTHIDKLYFAEHYYDEQQGRHPVDNLVLRGLNQGYEVLLLQYCNLVPSKAESINILKRIFAAAVYKATSVQYTGIGTQIDKRAIEHCNLALKIIDSLDMFKSDSTDIEGNFVKFVSVLKESGAVPADFDHNVI